MFRPPSEQNPRSPTQCYSIIEKRIKNSSSSTGLIIIKGLRRRFRLLPRLLLRDNSATTRWSSVKSLQSTTIPSLSSTSPPVFAESTIFFRFEPFDCQIEFLETVIWCQITNFETVIWCRQKFSVSHSWCRQKFDRQLCRRPPTVFFYFLKKVLVLCKSAVYLFCRELNSLQYGENSI